MLHNAAKRGKLIESYGNFGVSKFVGGKEGFSHEGV